MMNPSTTQKDVQKKDNDQKLKSRGMWGQLPKTNGGWVIQFLIAFVFVVYFIGIVLLMLSLSSFLIVLLIDLIKGNFHLPMLLQDLLMALQDLLMALQARDLLSAVATSVLISVAILGARTAYHAYSVSQDILSETRERGKINETLEAWNTVTKKFSGGGKLRALEFLAKRGESLDGIDLSKETMGGHVYLGKIDLSEETIGRKASLNAANFAGANLSSAKLGGVDLIRADLTGANLTGINLDCSNLYNAILNKANIGCHEYEEFNHVHNIKKRSYSSKDSSHLNDAILNNAHLNEADLTCANLYSTRLNNAHLIKTKLSNVSLFNAHLKNANLKCADLRSAQLDNVNFNGAKLTGTDLRGVSFNCRNVGDVNFTDADLSCAILTDTKGLTQEQLDKAYYREPEDMLEGELSEIKEYYKEKETRLSDEIIKNFPRPALPDGLKIKSKEERDRERENEKAQPPFSLL